MATTLNSLSIESDKFFDDNDIDLHCPTCKGTGQGRPDGAKVEAFRPTEEQVEEHKLEIGTDYFRVVGISALEEECYETAEEAQEACDDPENWPDDGEDCEDCENGYLSVIWNTIWDTGFSTEGRQLPQTIGSVVAFDYDGNVWFGLSGAGMDFSPQLVGAWFKLFPDCQWVPENWINTTNLYGGYYGSEAGKLVEAKLFAVYKGQLESTIKQSQHDLNRLNEFLAERAKKAPKAKGKKPPKGR